MREFYLNYEGGKVFFSLPEQWQVISDHEKPVAPVVRDIGAEIDRALDNPVGAPPIEALARPDTKVTLLFDDHQRPTPSHMALPRIMNRLNRAGVPDEQIFALCATGTHPAPNPEQLQAKAGAEIIGRLGDRLRVHDAKASEMVVLGDMVGGGIVEVNRMVADADLVIGVGECMPHPGAGYGGGYKIIMPGVSSYRSVAAHHFALDYGKNMRVNCLDGNLFWERIVQAGRLTRLAFKIDFVMNERREVIRAFAGHPEAEQREAARFAESLYVVNLPHEADITITSAAPLEIGVQATKALTMATGCTRPGGTIIWVASQRQAGPILPLIREMASPLKGAEVRVRFAQGDVPDHLTEFGISYIIQIADFKEMTETFRIIHVTEGLTPEQVRMMGMTWSSDLQRSINRLSRECPIASVAVFPSGGNVIPQVLNRG
jgi:nickel-dependent lactate racemase